MPHQLESEYDVFISYSSHDKEWVRGELLKGIEKVGLRVFIDFRDFKRGAPSIKEMERGVSTCPKTLLVLTPDYVESEWCEIENIMSQARDPANRDLRLIPLLKTQCRKPLRLGALTHVDFTVDADFELAWQQLLTALGAQAERPAGKDVATEIQGTRTRAASYVAKRIRKHKSAFAIGLLVLLLSAVVLSYLIWLRQPSHAAAPVESIAVLPFVNESGNADVEYLSDGMTESLINSLSQLPRLSVKARSSVFRYKGKDTTPQTIATELSVQAILTGRVVQRGDNLTLYLSLVDSRNGNQLWGAQYNRKSAELLSLQSEIARDVANKLRMTLSGNDEKKVAKNYTTNAEAYQLYLRGRFHQRKNTPQELQKAIEYFQQAITLDSHFPLAYAGLAFAYAPLSDLASLQPRELMLKAKEAALQALSLDDQSGEAHTALGCILYAYDYDFAGAEREFKHAIELNPNDLDAHGAYGDLLTCLGRHEESLVEVRRAVEIDPLSLGANCQYGESLSFARRYDEAIAQLKKTLELDDSYWLTHYYLAITYNMKGDYAESVAERVKIHELFSRTQTAALIRESFARGGRQGFLRAMTGKRGPINLAPYIVATFYVELGEKDKALAILNQMYKEHNCELILLKVDPRLDPLRDDPGFQDLLRRVGF